MKKAIAVSCLCFIMTTALVSCGKKDSSPSETGSRVTTTPGSVPVSSDYEENTVTSPYITSDSDGFTDPGAGDINENGVMPDGTSPLEMIPDAAETAVSDAENIVSDIIDDLT